MRYCIVHHYFRWITVLILGTACVSHSQEDGDGEIAYCGSVRNLSPGQTIQFSNAKTEPKLGLPRGFEDKRVTATTTMGWQQSPTRSYHPQPTHHLPHSGSAPEYNGNSFQRRTISFESKTEPINYEKATSKNKMGLGSHVRGELPLLYSGYFKPQKLSFSHQQKANPDLFDLFVKGAEEGTRRMVGRRRRRRYLAEHENDEEGMTGRECIWRFSTIKGKAAGCSTFVTHLRRGDTAAMTCDQERLLLTTSTNTTTYCGTIRLQKTTNQEGPTLQLRHESNFGSEERTRELLEGYVHCSPS